MAEKTELNYIQELLDSTDVRIANLCTGARADGSEFYVYLLQTYRQMSALQQVMAIGATFDFAEFGEVLAYGEGTEPSEKVRKEVESKHKLNHKFEEELMESLKELQEEFGRMKKRGISEQDYLKKKISELVKEIKDEENK